MNDLVNMQDMKEKISEQIKVSIFNLLPDEKIAQLVDAEVEAFFEAQGSEFWGVKETGGGYGSNKTTVIMSKVSPFRLMVWEQLQKHLKDQLEEIFQSAEFITRCEIGDGKVKTDIQNAAMTRQEQIALSMSSMMFDRMVGESLRMGTQDTRCALEQAVFEVLSRNNKL